MEQKQTRLTKDEYYLEIAKTVAIRSTCRRRQYGAVIVNNDEIISVGYNGAPRGEEHCCDRGYCYKDLNESPVDESAAVHGNQYGVCPAVHAEQNAMLVAPRWEMIGATLYLACLAENVKAIPCNVCNRMIKNAGISKVVSAKYEWRSGS